MDLAQMTLSQHGSLSEQYKIRLWWVICFPPPQFSAYSITSQCPQNSQPVPQVLTVKWSRTSERLTHTYSWWLPVMLGYTVRGRLVDRINSRLKGLWTHLHAGTLWLHCHLWPQKAQHLCHGFLPCLPTNTWARLEPHINPLPANSSRSR